MTGHVKVKFNNSDHAVFTDENGNVPLGNLKDAIPSADGLQYREQVPPFALLKLPRADGIIKLIKDISEYEAYSNSSSSKVNEMVDKIRFSRGCKSSNRQLCPSPALYDDKVNVLEKSMMIGSRKKMAKVTHPKKIKMGFLYQAQPSEPYKHIKKMTGGIKCIELIEGQFFNAQQILDAGIAIYSSPLQNKNCYQYVLKIIETSTLRLGDAEGYEDEDFNLDNLNYGFWEFLTATSTPPSKITLYILAEKRQAVAENPLSLNRQVIEDFEKNEIVNHHNLEDSDDELVSEENANNVIQNQEQFLLVNNVNVNGQQNIDRINVTYQFVTWSKYTGMPSITQCNFEQAYEFVKTSNPDCPPYSEFDPLKNGFQICRIEKNNELLLDITVDESVNSREAKFDFKFPTLENDLINYEPHCVLYDCTQLVGQLEDGHYGIGCITFCDFSCQPTFNWIKNGALYKSQKFLYVLRLENNNDENEDGVEWTCEIKCMQTCLDRYMKADPSKALPITQPKVDDYTEAIDESTVASTSTESYPNSEPVTKKYCIQNSNGKTFDQVLTFEDVSNIVIMDKKKLYFYKTVLRQVGQMKERNGNYLGTDVSIKSYQFDEETIKLIKNEISMSKIIKHPNIVMLMGITIESITLHLITEKFQAHSLFDAIFDETIKNYLKLDVDKKKVVAKQICQAVAYIHEQTLVCKSISPFGILINENCHIKVRDVGIDTSFKDKHTELLRLKLYEAPEIILRNKPESLASDTWSLACVLFELFSETRAFDISNNNNDNFNNELKLSMNNEQKPNTALVYPKDLQDVLNPCFNYDAIERPQVSIISQYFIKK